MSRYVIPRLTSNSKADSGGRHAVLFTQLRHTNLGRPVLIPYLPHRFFRQFCGTLDSPVLLYPIADIIKCGTQEEMVGTQAGRVIATVENIHTWRNGLKMQAPRNPVAHVKAPVGGYLAISVTRLTANPYPTSTEFWTVVWHRAILVDLSPEALLKWLRVGVTVHKPQWFTNNITQALMYPRCQFRFLAASAVAVTVGDFARGVGCGIMKLHRKITPFVAMLRAVSAAPGLSCAHYTIARRRAQV
ncbi:MAG: hypothetical protein Q7O66_16640 [Dehalococcoidia bacterium]|nr:hypothetical protein [Dehalococcoidia bacterium]